MQNLHQQVHGMQRRLEEGQEEANEALKSLGVVSATEAAG